MRSVYRAAGLKQTRVLVFVASCVLCMLWIGCNAILGNESASFEPDASNGSSSGTSSGADGGSSGNTDGGTSSSGSLDGSQPDGTITDTSTPPIDAGPCVNLESNPRHCGVCNHDCLNGECADASCQPFTLAQVPGALLAAIAVSPSHAYWANETTGDIQRAPITGAGPTELVYDGPVNAGLGDDFSVHQGNVYFSGGEKLVGSGILKCAESGCGTTATVVVDGVNHARAVITQSDGAIIFTEGVFNGRVGRCKTPPCTGATVFDVIAAAERFPTLVSATGNTIVWSTLIPPTVPAGSPPEVRGSVNGASAATIIGAFDVTDVGILAGTEIAYATQNGSLRAVPIGGGPSRVLVTQSTQTKYLSADGNSVFYPDLGSSTSDGRILRYDKSASTVAVATALATKQQKPTALTTDANSVYWIGSGNSTIMRIAK